MNSPLPRRLSPPPLLAFAVVLLALRGAMPASAWERAPRLPALIVAETKESVREGGAADRLARLLRATEAIEPAVRAWDSLTREELAKARSVVLAARAPARAAASFEDFEKFVIDGGTLLALGAAAESWAGAKGADIFFGRRAELADAPADRAASPLQVAVLDQSHPVTQCVSHFLHRGALPRAQPAEKTVIYASARWIPKSADGAAGAESSALADELVPVLWGNRAGLGRVLVSALEPNGGPADVLLATLFGRVLEWGAARNVTLRLPADTPWLAVDPAWDGRGFLPGLPEREGFFMGRQIAPFMSYLGADWLVRAEREEAEQPERVLDELQIAAGSAIADLGAGNGYFSLRLARRVGPEGRVFAVEIQQEMLDLLKLRMEKENLKNIDLVLSTEKDPRLAPASVDLVLMVDVYHELSDPRAVMAALRNALKPKGRVALVEYRGEDPGVQIKPAHRTTEAQVRGELRALGFRWLRTLEFLRNQRVMEFAATD